SSGFGWWCATRPAWGLSRMSLSTAYGRRSRIITRKGEVEMTTVQTHSNASLAATPGEASPPGSAQGAAIEINELVVNYGTKRAVDGLTLRVPAGAIYGFLGPNGAGKTTTIKTLLGLRRPDGGSARVL